MPTATIFDIERNSFVDGPGIRTTVFFKGCPLKCKWCHNPESIDFKPQTALYKNKCIGCGECKQDGFTPEFLKGLKNIKAVKVLPYHNYAGSKYAALDMENTLPKILLTREEIKKVENMLVLY